MLMPLTYSNRVGYLDRFKKSIEFMASPLIRYKEIHQGHGCSG